MTPELQSWVSVALLVLARVSVVIAVLPFFSSARVPAVVRAYIAIALSIALTPMVHAEAGPVVSGRVASEQFELLAGEIVVGAFLGLLVRIFFVALAFVGEFIAQMIGFTGMFMPSVTENEMVSPLADLVLLFSAVLFFTSELHLVLMERFVSLYGIVPIGLPLNIDAAAASLSQVLSDSFTWALQLSGPFVLYATVCNVLLGLANRLVPQVPIQLVAAPIVLLGGLGVAYLALVIATEFFFRNLFGWANPG